MGAGPDGIANVPLMGGGRLMWGLQRRGSAIPLRKGLEAGPGHLCCLGGLGSPTPTPAAWGSDLEETTDSWQPGSCLACWAAVSNVSPILGSVTGEES